LGDVTQAWYWAVEHSEEPAQQRLIAQVWMVWGDFMILGFNRGRGKDDEEGGGKVTR